MFSGSNPLSPTLSPLGRGEGVKNSVKGVLPKCAQSLDRGCPQPQRAEFVPNSRNSRRMFPV
jgi:hypothetical protein